MEPSIRSRTQVESADVSALDPARIAEGPAQSSDGCIEHRVRHRQMK